MTKSRAPRRVAIALSQAAEEYVAGLKQFEAEQSEFLIRARQALPPSGYAVPMAAHVLERRANETVDHVVPWGFADFSVSFRILAETLAELAPTMSDSPIPLYINVVRDEDPAVETYLLIKFGQILALNERVSVESGKRIVSQDGERYLSAIADSRRRSALTLLRTKALYLEHSEEERKIINGAVENGGGHDSDIALRAKLTLLLDMREIDVLRKGLPETWQRMLTALEVREASLLSLLAFASLLPAMGYRWLDEDTLFDLLGSFTSAYERDPIDNRELIRLMNLLSSDPETARRTGSAVPFLRISSQYRAWPFVYHAMLPELVFIAQVQSKRGEIWSTTFGSDLARAADYIADQLQQFKNITVVTRKKKSGIGDIDLGIYDHDTNELLICEVKTVFDRFRTEFQASNFTDDRVNFGKAVQQLNAARNALLSGQWSLKDIFGKTVPANPSNVYRVVLLWRDHINPSLDGGDFTPACDFSTFRYLFERCAGKPRIVAESIEQLEKIFWVSRYRIDFWPVGDDTLAYAREEETDALPPMSFLDKLPLNEIVRAEVRTLRHFPPDWEEQLEAANDEALPQFLSQLT
ncbi:hypothetical protein [Paracoccus marcusii]|uniref:NERD domain-containing protein n=1 Tax=Paracoccus marcusii TaxID=59779 RepID=A0ABY7UV27_9RHOB|nr:hypothetical protein [Paracoccus marcusii]WDA13447.1 hypothetical protein PRL19_04125 [Paracoccus marcusii]